MNLYIFNETSRAAIYGIGTYIGELTAALKDSEINVNLVHLRSDKKDVEITESDDIRHIHIPNPINRNSSPDPNKLRDLYNRNVAYILRMQIKDTENPVFHLNYNQSGKLAEALKKAFGCRIVMTVHYFEWCLSLFGNSARLRGILDRQDSDHGDKLTSTVIELFQKEKELFQMTDHILCLSEFARQILQDDYRIEPNIITVVYNGLTDRNTVPDKLSLRQKYHIPDIPVFLFVGRLDDVKGLKYVLQAFKFVLKTQPHCHFILAGDGTFNVYMKECEDIWLHITWTGMVDRKRYEELYSGEMFRKNMLDFYKSVDNDFVE